MEIFQGFGGAENGISPQPYNLLIGKTVDLLNSPNKDLMN
jgi:hypothetical protein